MLPKKTDTVFDPVVTSSPNKLVLVLRGTSPLEDLPHRRVGGRLTCESRSCGQLSGNTRLLSGLAKRFCRLNPCRQIGFPFLVRSFCLLHVGGLVSFEILKSLVCCRVFLL